jgi:hypothetical protein
LRTEAERCRTWRGMRRSLMSRNAGNRVASGRKDMAVASCQRRVTPYPPIALWAVLDLRQTWSPMGVSPPGAGRYIFIGFACWRRPSLPRCTRVLGSLPLGAARRLLRPGSWQMVCGSSDGLSWSVGSIVPGSSLPGRHSRRIRGSPPCVQTRYWSCWWVTCSG